jgi:Family of unknown function (DUF5522)
MHDSIEPNRYSEEPLETFVEGRDFYFDGGLMVLTRRYLQNRGYCCDNKCRHCPYDKNDLQSRKTSSSDSLDRTSN